MKKIRRRDDDDSSYSDDSSRSLSVSLSSDSEDDYRRSRKARSRVRDNVKRGKKRGRRSLSSSSRGSSVDSPRVKKRKRSKRAGESKVRKKVNKKKHKRKASVSFSSSESPSESSGSEGRGVERVRGRSREKRKEDRKSLGDARRVSKKRESWRSRSCSSCSRSSNRSYDQSMENTIGDIGSRRLRSVITVVKHYDEKEEIEQEKDERKEEIFYDQDDYPSSRSNDSNDGVKKDLAYCSNLTYERTIENLKAKEDSASKVKPKESDSKSEYGMDQSDEVNNHSDGARVKDAFKENDTEDSASVAGSGTVDLETILRQKALENLMRFRGGPKTKVETATFPEDKGERNVKLSVTKGNVVQNKSHEQELSVAIGETEAVDKNNWPVLRNDSSSAMQIEENKVDGGDSSIETKAANRTVSHPSNREAMSCNLKDKDYTKADVTNNETKSNMALSNLKTPVASSSQKQVTLSNVSLQKTSLLTNNTIDDSAAETSKTLAGSSGNNQNLGIAAAAAAAAASDPSVKPIELTADHSSKESQNGSNPNSQFEQKTMSVMRGGEMVQVTFSRNLR